MGVRPRFAIVGVSEMSVALAGSCQVTLAKIVAAAGIWLSTQRAIAGSVAPIKMVGGSRQTAQITARHITPAEASSTSQARARPGELSGEGDVTVQMSPKKVWRRLTDPESLRTIIRTVTENLKVPDQVQWAVDVDPLDLL